MHEIRKEMCQSISNIASGPLEYKILILKHNLVPILCTYLMYGISSVQEKVLYAVSNLSSNASRQIMDVMLDQHNVIQSMALYLTNIKYIDVNILSVVVEFLDNVLGYGQDNVVAGDSNPYVSKVEQHGLLEFLLNLNKKKHLGDQIHCRVVEVLGKYWSGYHLKDLKQKRNKKRKMNARLDHDW